MNGLIALLLVATPQAALVPGDWVAFELCAGADRRSYMRLTVASEEGADRWVELELAAHPSFSAPLAQVRVLVTPSSGGWRITRAWAALGLSRLEEVPGGWVDRMFRAGTVASSAAPDSGDLRRGQERSLLTAFGTVKATPVEILAQGILVERIWMSPQVPILSVARWELPAAKHRLEVIAVGRGAPPRMRLPLPNARGPF